MKAILLLLFKRRATIKLTEYIVKRNGRMRWVKIRETNHIQLWKSNTWVTVHISTSDHEAIKFFY